MSYVTMGNPCSQPSKGQTLNVGWRPNCGSQWPQLVLSDKTYPFFDFLCQVLYIISGNSLLKFRDLVKQCKKIIFCIVSFLLHDKLV